MAIFSGKTIILGTTKHYNMDAVIEKELINVGFKVINISFHNNDFVYRNFIDRLENFFMKTVLLRKHYQTNIEFRYKKKGIYDKLELIEKSDYCLIIRPDVYPIDFLTFLKGKTKKLIGYQWDGLKRFPTIYDRINIFDRFFVFDPVDLSTPNVLPTTNFYLNAISKVKFDKELQSDVFYSGYFIKSRLESLKKLIYSCQDLGFKVKYYLVHRKSSYANRNYGLKITNKQLNYEQNILLTYNSKTILDLVTPEHEGLSFRVFEAIGFEKKIITTNQRIKEYDFYNSNNIMIWKNNDIEELKKFLNKPYIALDAKIKDKYGFENWIKYALDVQHYIPLTIH